MWNWLHIFMAYHYYQPFLFWYISRGVTYIIVNLAACGGIFLDRINKIFLYSLYLPAGRQVLNIPSILSKKGNSLYYWIIAHRMYVWSIAYHIISPFAYCCLFGMEGKTLLIDMQKNFFVGQYYFVFCRIPCCVGGLEEVFRAIVNRQKKWWTAFPTQVRALRMIRIDAT